MPDKQEAGTSRQRVSISLESRNGNDRVVQLMEGELYPRDNCIFLRYQELAEAGMGRTFTTIRIEPRQLRIVRQGDIKHEQTFREGFRHLGFIQTPHGRIEMETVTKAVEVRMDDLPGGTLFIGWSYELTVMGEAAGIYQVEIAVAPYDAQ
jgi:uncharacterized beta-barrel protein YwiB (DUF1934 family)